MYRKSRIISMGAGAVLAAGALIYFPSRGLSEER